jgi:hypothetical protein
MKAPKIDQFRVKREDDLPKQSKRVWLTDSWHNDLIAALGEFVGTVRGAACVR